MLVAKGYCDIGWNPVEGERYLDFLRFAVFCNGKLKIEVFIFSIFVHTVFFFKYENMD